jgi:hypothetical protein
METTQSTTTDQTHALSAGFSLLWRRQGILWWIFVVNLVCGALGTVPATLALHRSLEHSFAGQPLTHRFDLGMLIELFRLPDVSLWRFSTSSYLFAFVFFVFMLFVTGGILETYRADRRLTTGEFFSASGAFFWPFLRLLLLSIIPFVIVSMIYQGLSKLADHVGDRSIADQVGIFMFWGAVLVFLLLGLWVRLWFDMAQVRAVAQSDRRMWRNTWRAWRITWHDLGGLYWIYLRTALFAWITLGVGIFLWTMLPATATGAVFIILELIMFAQIASRLWQLSSAMTWYRGHAEMIPAVVDYASPAPEEPVTPAATVTETTSLPPGETGPELPPADA